MLGAAGFALSYDALRQMAQAVHVRGPLTLLFPLLIDGFIAYGIRALLVLRTAPLAARIYAWSLFGSATAASIWANALHAVRLNEWSDPATGGLRLGDATVGVLSTLAPLALAGAVHLYILIARATGPDTGQPATATLSETRGQPLTPTGATTPDHQPEGEWDTPPPARTTAPEGGHLGGQASAPGTSTSADGDRSPRTDPRTATRKLHAVPSDPDTDQGHDQQGHPADTRPATLPGHRPTPSGDRPETPAEQGDRRDPVTEEDLLALARTAVADSGQVTRAVVAGAIRGQGIPLSNDRLTVLMRKLR
nr:DUF2637 domain-containing protein [Streptomyces sp. SID3343]